MTNSNSVVEKIDTDAVRTIANNLKSLNCQMRDRFDNVEAALSKLEVCWHGETASVAVKSFEEIKPLLDSRFTVMDSYANFLLSHIGDNYEKTDMKNKSIADVYK